MEKKMTIVEQIARKNGVSAESVRMEMEQAIEMAMKNPDPVKRENFKRMFGEKRPSAEEFIIKMAAEVKKGR